MNIKKLLGMIVLDNTANEIGKIRDVEFDEQTGKLSTLVVNLKKNILSNDEVEIPYEDVKSIGDYVLADITTENVKANIDEDKDENEDEDEE